MSMRIAGQTLVSNYGFDEDYLEAIIRNVEANRIKLVLIGLDPFLTDAIGIPFCKDSWSMLKNGSGYIVFVSILGNKNLEVRTDTPKSFVIKLLEEEGVILLNSSYALLKGLEDDEKDEAILDAYNFNKFCINKIENKKNIVFLGEQAYSNTAKGHFMESFGITYELSFHPAARSANRKKEKWMKYWGLTTSDDPSQSLRNTFNLTII